MEGQFSREQGDFSLFVQRIASVFTAEEFGQRGNTRGEGSSYHIVEIGNQLEV